MVCDDIEGPLVLWLQGGPGWPSMFGMFKENGPFSIHVERKGNNKKIRDNFRPHPIWMILSEEGRKVCSKLMRNPDSWHQDASMLYIDSPVRVGRAVGFIIFFRFLDIHNWMQKLNNYLAYIICSICKSWGKSWDMSKSRSQVGTGFSHTKSSSNQPTTDAQVPSSSMSYYMFTMFNMFARRWQFIWLRHSGKHFPFWTDFQI